MFKFPHMSEAAKIFCQHKRREFLDTYTTNIPEVFWFQGDRCSSAELVHNPTQAVFVWYQRLTALKPGSWWRP